MDNICKYNRILLLIMLGLFISSSCTNNFANKPVPVVQYYLNQSIDYSNVKWVISGVKDVGEKLTTEDVQFFNATIEDTLPSGRFIEVYWWIENLSGKDIPNPAGPVIIDEQNREYQIFTNFNNWKENPPVPGSSFWVGSPELGMPLILQSRTIPYYRTVFYDVPNDAKELKLKIPDLMNENSKIVLVNLNLD